MAGKVNRLAGDRISPAPGLAADDFQCAEPDYVNALTVLEMSFDDIKQQIDQTHRIAICQAAVMLVNHSCEIGLGHYPAPLLELQRRGRVHRTACWVSAGDGRATRAALCYEIRLAVSMIAPTEKR